MLMQQPVPNDSPAEAQPVAVPVFALNETLEMRIYSPSELNLIYPRVYFRQKDSLLHLTSPQRRYLGASMGYKVLDLVSRGQIVRDLWHDVTDQQQRRIGLLQLSVWFEPNKESQRERDLDVLLVNDMAEGQCGLRYFSSLNSRAEMDEINMAMAHVNRMIELGLIDEVQIETKSGGLHYLVVRFRRTALKIEGEMVDRLSREERDVQSMLNSQMGAVNLGASSVQKKDPNAKV